MSRFSLAFAVGLLAAYLLSVSLAEASRVEDPAPRVIIRVDADKPGGKVSKYLTGACIEDVNHEIYGGLYSQMLFGESFQEPPRHQPLQGFTVIEGDWILKGEELQGGAGNGPKLVSDGPPFSTGNVAVEVFFPDRSAGNSGLILKVGKPEPGADNFDGYEVSLNPADQKLVLGRHRHNWEPIKEYACAVPVGEWVRLAVKTTETTLDVQVNGKTIAAYEDRTHPLKTGGFGLRQWRRTARYRNLTVRMGGKPEPISFRPNPDDAGPVSGMWRPVHSGPSTARNSLETKNPFVGTQSQRITLKGEGEAGIENQGLNRWGLSFQAGKEYEGFVWARAEQPVELVAALESRDGLRTYARTKLAVKGPEWHKVSFTFTPDAKETNGRFVLKLTSPGSVVLGHAFLQPGEWGRFKGLPVRKDVAEGIIDMGVTVLRYGGSMVNAPAYRWKKMIGPRDRRPSCPGTWYPYSSNGWGIIDFLNFCEAAGFLAIPAFNLDESPRDMADFVAYVNGAAHSEWGKKRVADGHPAPYRLKHIEIGNEERVDDKYHEKFKAIAEAVWAIDPDIVLVVGDFVYGRPISDSNRITGAASGITSLAAHSKILELAKRHGREVWFDIHVGTEHPGALGEVAAAPTYVAALHKLAAGAKHQVVIFELNSGNHAQRRALANAIALGELQGLGERLPIVCSANGLQPDGQNDNGWDQGLLFLDPSRVWLQPPGYVSRMIARSYQPTHVPTAVAGDDHLRVAAARSADGKTLVVRVVNSGDQPVTAGFHWRGFMPAKKVASVEELAGSMDAANSAIQPTRIAPRSFEWQHGGEPRIFSFPPRSFTVIVVE